MSVNVNGVSARCSNCNYEFSSSIAPKLSSITPTSVSDITTITIQGSQFGTDASKINVKIGSDFCTVTDLNDTQIKCTLNALRLGSQAVVVNLNGTCLILICLKYAVK